MKITVILQDDGYLLRAEDGTESDEVEYGESVEFEHGGRKYLAHLELDEDDNPVTVWESGQTVYAVDSVEIEFEEDYSEEGDEPDADAEEGEENAD